MQYFSLLLTVSLLLGGSASLFAQKVMDLSKPSAWEQAKHLKNAPDGSLIVGKKLFICSKLFPMDPNKKYTLSFTVSTKKGSSRILAGFESFLSPGRPISPRSANAVPGTFAPLLKDAPKGARKIQIPAGDKELAKLLPRPHYSLMAKAKRDFSDLPNFNRVSGNLQRIDKDGNIFTLTFKDPLTRTLKKGEFIRLHGDGAYMYTAGVRTVTAQKAVMKGSIKGFAAPGKYIYNKWPHKTKFGRVILLVNWNNQKVETVFKDFKLIIE